jgi:ABC-type Na+ efflux pump permease subunit
LVVLVVQIYVLVEVGWDSVGAWQWLLGVLLGTGLLVSAAGSFRVEREEGAFELLLVTPITEAEVIWGRLRGLWAEVLPSIVLLVGVSVAWWLGGGPQSRWYPATGHAASMMGSVAAAVGWLAVPVIGLRASFRFRTFPAALAVAWVWAFVVPALGYVVVLFASGELLASRFDPSGAYIAAMFAWVCTQVAVAGGHWAVLHEGLVRREFRRGEAGGLRL